MYYDELEQLCDALHRLMEWQFQNGEVECRFWYMEELQCFHQGKYIQRCVCVLFMLLCSVCTGCCSV